MSNRLCEVLKEISYDKNLANVDFIDEWEIDNPCYEEGHGNCVCGKEIKHIFNIVHKLTNERVQVGSTCLQYFHGKKIFKVIKQEKEKTMQVIRKKLAYEKNEQLYKGNKYIITFLDQNRLFLTERNVEFVNSIKSANWITYRQLEVLEKIKIRVTSKKKKLKKCRKKQMFN